MVIGEMLLCDLAKLVIRAAEDQENTACGNLQICAGLETVTEGATHAVGQRRLERVRSISSEEENVSVEGEEESQGVVGTLNNLSIETGVT